MSYMSDMELTSHVCDQRRILNMISTISCYVYVLKKMQFFYSLPMLDVNGNIISLFYND